MGFRFYFAIAVGKLLIKVLRLFRLGGTSLPGKAAMKLCPGLLRKAAVNFRVIMVTGTNGKTTTSRIMGQILSENGLKYISNRSGANLPDGIATTFVEAVGLNGKSRIDTALIEVDEAAFNRLADHIKPSVLVVTNFFRDQADRFEEPYTTLEHVRSGISKCPEIKLVLNADDSLSASLGQIPSKEVIFYGMEPSACGDMAEETGSEAPFCINCKSRYDYSFRSYGHLGGFSCPGCGYRRPSPQVTCKALTALTPRYTDAVFEVPGESFEARVNLPGLYNVYNALAAVAFGQLMGFQVKNTIEALGKFECGFGRMETVKAGFKTIRVILVKNPAGFNQVLDYLSGTGGAFQIAFIINDRTADGTDISWLWDLDFEKLKEALESTEAVYVSGLRAEDMALCLKYTGLSLEKIHIFKDFGKLIDTGLEKTPYGGHFYIVPTYTAMLELRKLLKKRFKLKDIWQ